MSNDAAAHADVETERWLQIHPQEMWHDDAIIEGNASALRALAGALLEAANTDAARLDEVFASDGEGYSIVIRRKERPNDFSDAFYVITVPCSYYADGRCTLARAHAISKDAAAATDTSASGKPDEAPSK